MKSELIDTITYDDIIDDTPNKKSRKKDVKVCLNNRLYWLDKWSNDGSILIAFQSITNSNIKQFWSRLQKYLNCEEITSYNYYNNYNWECYWGVNRSNQSKLSLITARHVN